MNDYLGLLWYWDLAKQAHTAVKAVPEAIAPIVIHSNNSVIGYLLTSIFIYFFAVYKADSYRRQIACLIGKFLLLILYVPLLVYCGAYVDAVIIASILALRIGYVLYFSLKYKTVDFLLFNDSRLCFSFGKASYVNTVFKHFMVFTGGHHYIDFGYNFVPFVDTSNLLVCIRGREELDLEFSRQIELCDGSYLYLFTSQPIVSIFNIVATTQLDETVIDL
uniref:ORF3 protein n=1 Tax=Bat Coronavirus MaJX20 TaxID=3018845 RepID=A0AA49ED20_9NIDO|nr:ORF3 protein [Bat Coronavirus MaJX20]